MARSSYTFAKRQREIAKKKKKEEKRLRKAKPTDTGSPDAETSDAPATDVPASGQNPAE